MLWFYMRELSICDYVMESMSSPLVLSSNLSLLSVSQSKKDPKLL